MATTTQRGTFTGYRASPEELARLDTLCHYVHLPRSRFVQMAVAFLDSAMVLEELARLEAQGDLTEDQAAVRVEATATMGDVLAGLRPRPIVPLSPN